MNSADLQSSNICHFSTKFIEAYSRKIINHADWQVGGPTQWFFSHERVEWQVPWGHSKCTRGRAYNSFLREERFPYGPKHIQRGTYIPALRTSTCQQEINGVVLIMHGVTTWPPQQCPMHYSSLVYMHHACQGLGAGSCSLLWALFICLCWGWNTAYYGELMESLTD